MLRGPFATRGPRESDHSVDERVSYRAGRSAAAHWRVAHPRRTTCREDTRPRRCSWPPRCGFTLSRRPATLPVDSGAIDQIHEQEPYDRFPDGRPKVPDEMLERLKVLVAEEVQAVLPNRGFPNQFEPRDGWKVLQPNQKMVGPGVRVQFMPARGDIIEVDEAEAKAKGTTAARNQTAIDMLQPAM